MHNVRYPLVILGCSALWLLACWPVLLWLIYCSTAVAAVEFTQQVGAIGTSVLLWGFLLLAIGAMVFPPIPAGIRLSFARLRLMLTTDRSTLMRNLFELRHIETPHDILKSAGSRCSLATTHKPLSICNARTISNREIRPRCI